MKAWHWLQGHYDWQAVKKIVIRTILFLIFFNLIYILVQPMNWLDKLSVYNVLVPGRARLSNALVGGTFYGATVGNYDEALAGHEISSGSKPKDEYRIITLGDSGVWGWGGSWDQSLTACINQLGLKTHDGRKIRVFNLGYLGPSVLRELILMQQAVKKYQVDHVVWFLSGLGVYRPHMLDEPDLKVNPMAVYNILDHYPIKVPPEITQLPRIPSLWDRTIFAQRDDIAIWVQDQLYGFVWMLTKRDYTPLPQTYLPDNPDSGENTLQIQTYRLQENQLTDDYFMLDGIEAGQQIARQAGASLTMLLEPMWIAPVGTTRYRYNPFYPKWYIDALRRVLLRASLIYGWDYSDWSTILENQYFTDSPFHYNPEGACKLAQFLAPVIQKN